MASCRSAYAVTRDLRAILVRKFGGDAGALRVPDISTMETLLAERAPLSRTGPARVVQGPRERSFGDAAHRRLLGSQGAFDGIDFSERMPKGR
jgi:hypothetical protein